MVKIFFPFSRSIPYEGRAPEKKRIDDYAAPKRDEYKREEYKRDSFKRPVAEYPKEPARGGNTYDSRSVPVHRGGGEPPSTKERYGIAPSDNRPSNNFGNGGARGGASGGGGGGRDERDLRYVGRWH